MHDYLTPQKFGGKRFSSEYYTAVSDLVKLLKPTATLATIAKALNNASFTTPNGMSWNRKRVSDFIRNAV